MAHGEKEAGGGGGSSGTIRELLAVFGFGVDTHELEEGENRLEGFISNLKNLAAGVAGAFALHEVYEFAEGQAHLLDKIDDTAAALGISTKEVQQWRFAAESLGDDSDKLLNMMGRLQVAQQAAAQGSKAQAEAFSSLGVSVRDSHGKMKEADQLFTDVAEGIKKIEDPSKAAAVATKLFGRAGRELLPFLKEGAKGIDELFESYEELGGGYTQEVIEQGAEFEKTNAKLTLSLTRLKDIILRSLFPVITRLVAWGTTLVSKFTELAKHSNIMKAAFVALGAAGLVFGAQMLIAAAPIIAIGAAIAGVLLLVDDLITMFEGGDSIIGRSIDKIFGKGAHTEVVKEIRDTWESVKDIFNSLRPGTQHLWDFMKWLLDKQEDIGKIVGYLPPVLAMKGLYKAGQFIGDNAAGGSEAPVEYTGHHTKPAFAVPDLYPVPRDRAAAPPGTFSFDSDRPGAGVMAQGAVVNVYPSAGMDEKRVGQVAAAEIDKHHRRRLRDAAATLPRARGE